MNRTNYSSGKRATGMRLLCAAIIFGFGCNVVMAQSVGSNEGGTVPQPVPEFPTFNWWNTDISQAPVDPKSTTYISGLGGSSRTLHPDFGGNATYGSDPDGIYGFPYVVVDGVTGSGKSPPPLQSVQFGYYGESDGVNHTTNTSFPFYPIPAQATTTPKWIECGDPGTVDDRSSCDRHLLIIDRDHKYLYEMWNVWYDSANSTWYAGSGAFFNMNLSARRPDGWTSADAAGLAIFPGLVRYDEVYNAYGTSVSAIRHAFRVTVESTNGYVFPASHNAGSTAGALPMGARLRLKPSVNITGYPAAMQKIFLAMKTYGLIVADNGSDMYVSGTYDTNWDNNILNPAFAGLTAADFDVITLGWEPPLNSVLPADTVIVGGSSTLVTVNLRSAAPAGGAVVTLAAQSPLSAPATVTVPAGKEQTTFTLSSTAITAAFTPTLVATYSGSKYTNIMRVLPPVTVNSLVVNPTSVVSGKTATGTVTLNEAAPTTGVTVSLTSTNTAAATEPASVVVPAGSSSASFTVTAKTVTTNTPDTITATSGSSAKTASLTVEP